MGGIEPPSRAYESLVLTIELHRLFEPRVKNNTRKLSIQRGSIYFQAGPGLVTTLGSPARLGRDPASSVPTSVGT